MLICVFIVFLLCRESSNLILVNKPLILRWFCHTYGDDLEQGEEAQDPTELLKRVVVVEVDNVCTKVVDRRTSADGLELSQHLDAGGNVVKPSSMA
jgi:hypothetical protein